MQQVSNRRIPKQSRGQQRVDLILDTASDLFSEIGYEATTTNAIAERAGISIGSLYQYYPDKTAILQDLFKRYNERIREVLNQIDTPDLVYLPPEVLIDRMLDPFLALYDQCPIYAYLLLGSDVSADIGRAAHAMDQEANERITGIVRRLATNLDEERVRVVAMLCISQVKTLTSLLVSTKDEAFQKRATREVKQMLVSYIKTLVEVRDSS